MPDDVRITRVVSFGLESTRPKFVGKNSSRHDHGRKAWDHVVRLYTNTGVDGFGSCGAGANECVQLLGRNPLDLLDRDARTVNSPLGRASAPVWDLAGKLLGQPVWRLLGGAGPERVRVYDGSIYFTDLRPEHRDDWPDAFRRELDVSLAAGHRAFKVKIGRGKMWMLREPGYERDLEVLRVIRGHVGRDVLIGVDANTAFDLAGTRRFLRDAASIGLAFVEEMLPDSIDDWLALEAFIREHGWHTLVADGENVSRPRETQSWVDAEAVDILQGDMRRFGFEGVLAEAAMAEPHGIRVAPHNWGSLLGYYMQLHVGRAIRNFYMAEQDPLSCPAVIADGFAIQDGAVAIPDTPGLGLKLNDAALPEVANVHFDLRA